MAETKQKKEASQKKSDSKTKKKSHFWLWVIVILLVWWFNNYTLRTNDTEIASSSVHSTVKLAVISDLHATKHGIKNKTIFEAVDKEHPDVVFFLGDMYTRQSEWELIQKPVDLADMLVSAGYPLYCVTGEHDYDDRYVEELKKAGARVLSYDEDTIEVRGSRLHIMGIDNVYYSPTFDLNNAFALDENSFDILLAHIPNYEKFAEFGAELTLCGDTHGEMARLPFGLGPVYCSEKKVWFPKLLHKELEIYDKGCFSYDGGRMFITSGIGVYPAPVRLCNRPEIAVIEVKPKG
ncbi:metallophosphoesterase [Ruminococcus sp.]|uniref:metallophosphoesterase n=1 Tax=Ruminococcus sp. TaxID=41978 RepID=UPI002C526605|nr:metallophosphoesterase [Ruminococcus sp.]HNZ98682.1 metallophosphoesterase [Ruminococcus sp.]HOH86474.1 metallophosphoesterase [Ruminococcus sp.]